MSEEKTITLKKSTLWKFTTGVFLLLFLLSLFGVFNFQGQATKNLNGNTVKDIGANTNSGINARGLIEDNDPLYGEEGAPITVAEFSDFQCPYCARAFFGLVTELKNSDALKNGEVNLVYKHFPLNSIHPFAQKAAEAAECANQQDKFWEYHDMLFANQDALTVSDLKSYAGQAGLGTSEFNSCLDGNEAKSEVEKELRQATAAGGRGTPYFVVINNDNGKTTSVSGAIPYSQLEAAIASIQ